ncbi:complement C1q-like protein 2 [Pempheris klunzingeri]|uniref:complement C1q-like protein 2 n=1 Tax=Pempheris klunzingeri TaxID=3127111 RepID=UPI00397FC1F8
MRAIVLLCLLQTSYAALSPFSWNGPSATVGVPNADSACSTDQGSCGCCLMLQQMNKLQSYFSTSLDKLEEEYSQTKQSLNKIEASRTAFSVALFGDDRFKCQGPFEVNTRIVYKHIFLNLGDGYNETTGIFTVPRSGVYSIALTVYSDAGSPGELLAACANLQINDQVVAGSRDRNENDQEDSSSVVLVLHLDAGDRVSVNLPTGCFLCDDDSHYNTFSAFLLYVTE